jgi:hypothetical protein
MFDRAIVQLSQYKKKLILIDQRASSRRLASIFLDVLRNKQCCREQKRR